MVQRPHVTEVGAGLSTWSRHWDPSASIWSAVFTTEPTREATLINSASNWPECSRRAARICALESRSTRYIIRKGASITKHPGLRTRAAALNLRAALRRSRPPGDRLHPVRERSEHFSVDLGVVHAAAGRYMERMSRIPQQAQRGPAAETL